MSGSRSKRKTERNGPKIECAGAERGAGCDGAGIQNASVSLKDDAIQTL